MSTRDLIDFAQDGNAVEFRNELYAAIHDRVTAHIEAKKKEIAGSIFGQNEEVEELGEYSLEDYSLEEIQDFMQTEDYDQLDEISKKTLGSYIKKAHTQSSQNSHYIGMGNNDPVTREKAIRSMKNRTKGIRKAVDRLTKEEVEEFEEGYDSSGAYEKHDPKHPDFAKNYKKYKATNPQGQLGDFVAHMKKQK